MAFDPWAATHEGMTSLTGTLANIAQMRRQDEQMARSARLSDLSYNKELAEQGALTQAFGAPDYKSALALKMKGEQEAVMSERKQKGFTTYLNTLTALDKVEGLDDATKTKIGKEFLRQNPEYAPIADNLTFVGSRGIKAARNFAEGELKDPVSGQPLPAGYYETEGAWTGDAANPVKLTNYKLVLPKEEKAEETWGEPYAMTVGGKRAMVQKSSRGQIRPVVQDVSTTVKVSTGGGGAGKDFKNESAMRKEFLTLPEVKDFPTIQQSSKRALAALQEQGKGSNVAVDQSIITVFNKMLDPSSVVRESEYARTPQDLSILSRIKGKWDKVQRGGAGLDANERQALYRMINSFNTIANEQYNEQVDFYSGLAKRYGYRPENIVRLGGKRAPEVVAPGVPPVAPTKRPTVKPRNASDYMNKWNR